MKAHYFKGLFLLASIMLASLTIQAQTLKKDAHREYNTSSSTELKISNQFGSITVVDWDQNKVIIDVQVEVTASSNEKAQKILDKISIDFAESGNVLKATTKIGDDKMHVKTDKNEKQSFRIDYTVKCPKSINLKLDNQFGDLIISSLTGPLETDLQFGSMSAVSLTGSPVTIDIQFGKMTVGELREAKIDAQHCELLKVSEGGDITIDGQFCNLDFSGLKTLNAELQHSEAKVDGISEALKLDASFGNLKIENIGAGFKTVIVDQNMGDLTLGFVTNAGYLLNAEVNMGSIKLPSELKLTKEDKGDLPGVGVQKFEGTKGKGGSTIKIKTSMGSVRIQ